MATPAPLRSSARYLPVAVVAIVAVIVACVAWLAIHQYATGGSTGSYRLRISMANANQIYAGLPVQIQGQDVGKVVKVSAKGDSALVEVAVRGDRAPLHAGTTAFVEWQSLLAQHYVEIRPGPADARVLPSGTLIDSDEQVTVQDLLNTLNQPTRTHLQGTIDRLQTALSDEADPLHATLATAGPTVSDVQQVLDAVGQDGPALSEVVTKLNQVAAVLASRQTGLAGTVDGLVKLTGAAASQQEALTSTLQQLPTTLGVARQTLDVVPPTVANVDPLLSSLQPVVNRLPATAADLQPVLTRLQPILPVLDRTLDAANGLLTVTPGLLGSAEATLPGVTTALGSLQPALDFLRPYTPEAVGFSQTFGDGFAAYDANGHYLNAHVSVGPESLEGSPVGATARPAPLPGENVNQPWKDAYGSAAS